MRLMADLVKQGRLAHEVMGLLWQEEAKRFADSAQCALPVRQWSQIQALPRQAGARRGGRAFNRTCVKTRRDD